MTTLSEQFEPRDVLPRGQSKVRHRSPTTQLDRE
jgi:hypothetical protein